jgi:hypothetical protein
MMLISLDIDLAAAVEIEDLTSAVSPLFTTIQLTRRITEDYDVEFSAPQVKRIHLQNSWLRRHNNPTSK